MGGGGGKRCDRELGKEGREVGGGKRRGWGVGDAER